MKSKKFSLNITLLSIMLILICFCLCGCANVNFVTYHNDDGSIHEYVYLTIDEQLLQKHGYDVEAVKIEIETNSYLEVKNLIDEYQHKLYEHYTQNLLTSKEYTTLYNGVKIIEQKWNNSNFIVGLEYKNSTIYKKYHELLNGLSFKSNTKQIKKLFYTKTYYYGTTNYGDYTIFNRIYNYYANTVFASISPQETTLNYSYSVSTSRFHSDADNVAMDSNGNYIHTWKVNPNEPAGQICFYTISANRGVWIITCIMVGLTVTAILCMVGTINMLKNRNKNLLKIDDKNVNNIE